MNLTDSSNSRPNLRRTLRTIMVRTAVTAFTILVTLVLFEIYLRQTTAHVVRSGIESSLGTIEADPEVLVDGSTGHRKFVPDVHVTIKNHYLSHQDVTIDISKQGFRGSDVAVPKPAGIDRILMLGDSIVAADYLPNDATIPSVLQTTLNSTGTGRYEVINGGIGNIGTREELAILTERGIAIQPDTVVLAFYLNDSRPPWGFSGEIGDGGWLRRHSLLVETVVRQLKLRNFEKEYHDRFVWVDTAKKMEWRNDRSALLTLAHQARFDWGAAWVPEDLSQVRINFETLRTLSKQYNFKVLVTVLPVSFQVLADYLEDTPQRSIADLSKELGFVFADPLATLRSHSHETLYFDHCHMTELGNRLVAEFLAPFLEQKE